MARMSELEIHDERGEGRRRFLKILVTAPLALAIGSRFRLFDEAEAAEALFAASAPAKGVTARRAAPTPDCDDGEPTPSTRAGPFFTPNSPLRTSLREKGVPGTPWWIAGHVVTRQCKPVAGALLDFWHADGDGKYDNEGFRCRGHQFADSQGRYELETVKPGLYPGRTRHFHVRVQAPHGRILTTQLFFAGEPRNQRDGIFRPELLMRPGPSTASLAEPDGGEFNFVLDLA